MIFRAILWSAGLVAAIGTSAYAQRAQPGVLLLDTDFQTVSSYTTERQPLAAGWQVRVSHGAWTRTADGIRSTWTEGHQPVLVLEGSFGDCVIELEFRYRAEPGRWAACRVSPTNQALNPRAYAASVWANVDNKARAAGLVLEHDEWSPGPITQVARKMTEFKPDTWYQLRLEIVGDAAVATCNDVTVSGRFDRFGLPKTSLWLATGTSTHELRHLRVYAVDNAPQKQTAGAPTR